ncbi:tRNA(Ile)-lysidine synthase [Paracoccus isoporae]|uniref:tRNA(Ile)-lysidine synthase n=1 Tax=Paracoccus isoporae TaxID=591205 RepID=A0A1G6YRG6_9RHOB|nr:tRNA lysidine(34) synthetase TilS [Paracoccus isoporae]SDD92881.1 tRNA(Ile)-lysidine synthase [Paracoccus isoporae]
MPTDPKELERRAFVALDRLTDGVSGLGLAVSGGGDSVALMQLVSRWPGRSRHAVSVATVDHGLRAASAGEACGVARGAARLGFPHQTIRWDAGDGRGNLMARARAARLRLLSDWAGARGLGAVLLGHTRDDVAETLLMRLGRGAGIDGLSAMTERRASHGVEWLRPLLDVGRQELRDWLRQTDASWIEDPTNEDESFDRARIRRVMAEMGLDPAMLALSAANIAEARAALNAAMLPLIEDAEARLAALVLNRPRFAAAPAELRRRLVVAATRFVTGGDYPPRRSGVDHALQSLEAGTRVTLDGVVLDPSGDRLLVHREPAAATRAALDADRWDNRWKIIGLRKGDRVAALGDGVANLDWRTLGTTHLEAQALPVVVRDGRIILPLREAGDGLSATPIRDMLDFRRILLGH